MLSTTSSTMKQTTRIPTVLRKVFIYLAPITAGFSTIREGAAWNSAVVFPRESPNVAPNVTLDRSAICLHSFAKFQCIRPGAYRSLKLNVKVQGAAFEKKASAMQCGPHAISWFLIPKSQMNIGDRLDGLPVDRRQHVSLIHACFCCRSSRGY